MSDRTPLDIKDWVVLYQLKDEDAPRMTSRMSCQWVADTYAEGLKLKGHRVFLVGTVEALMRTIGVSDIPEMEGR